jgi:CRP/FNR family transcriptional regulator, cyclic AMP receptor protein
VRRLLSIARRRPFSRNEVVFHRQDPADSLHLIRKGRFAIRIMTPLGETVTIRPWARGQLPRDGARRRGEEALGDG